MDDHRPSFTASYITFGTHAYPKFCPTCGFPLNEVVSHGELYGECGRDWKHYYKYHGVAPILYDPMTGKPTSEQRPSFSEIETGDIQNGSASFDHPQLGQMEDTVKVTPVESYGLQMSADKLEKKKREKPKPPETIWEWIKFKFWEKIDGYGS